MAFTKDTAAMAGRLSSRANTPNKTTAEVREMFKGLLENNFDRLQKDIEELEPKDRVKTMLELAKFVLPTLKATNITDNREISPIKIIRLIKSDENDSDTY